MRQPILRHRASPGPTPTRPRRPPFRPHREWEFALAAALLVPGLLSAQAHEHRQHHGSPYADFTDRQIKALSPEEVEGLRSGAGLGMALAAELNRFPGPRHVLELKAMLGLTQDQESAIQAIFDAMEARARALGAEVIALEGELDRAFADGTITETRLDELLEAIGRTRARLRATHLRAHLQTLPVLTDAQLAHYQRARGYGG